MVNERFQWERQPKAEELIQKELDKCKQQNKAIDRLEKELLEVTSTRLFDWIDHVVIPSSEAKEKELENCGFVQFAATPFYRVFHHPGAQLPRVVLKDDAEEEYGIGVVVESIADYLMVRGLCLWIEGSPLSGYRKCLIANENNSSLWVVERRGVTSMEPTYYEENYPEKYIEATEKWMARPRTIENEEECIEQAILLAQELIDIVGQHAAPWIVLECERRYWQSKNTAGQIQKNRQDRLGMGWANHDHHTFRSSRKNFKSLVRLFETLGFHCRERFYAGYEAGWGAQVMENSECHLVLFLDVDLSEEEIQIDFSHHSLPDLGKLGTIGLWCALHGDSIAKAGMHHLEAQFMFDELTNDLKQQGVGMMEAFSNFPYLKQAFTVGERWKVDPSRLKKLVSEGLISKEQAEKFEKEGAIGSHLENLQRREGYKGFNQKNVSFIIKKTDPRMTTTLLGD